MNPHQLDPKALARIRRDAMRQRARHIRRSVTGLALALFTAAFVGIYVQLASGNDPALSKRHTTTTTAAASGTESSSGESASTSSEEAGGSESTGSESSTESSSTGSEGTAESPSAVTTRQS
jgi:hypothetical protein